MHNNDASKANKLFSRSTVTYNLRASGSKAMRIMSHSLSCHYIRQTRVGVVTRKLSPYGQYAGGTVLLMTNIK